MKILWVNPSFLDYRIPVYKRLWELCNGEFYIIFSHNTVPERIPHKIHKAIGSHAICFEGEKVNGHCPAVDVLFDSMAAFGSEVVGVILTGMGYDGAKGLLKMRKQGAYTIRQNEKSSVVYGMPKVAYSIGAVEIQLSLEQIAGKINSVV